MAGETPQELALIQEQRKECGNAIMIEHANNVHKRWLSFAQKLNLAMKSGDIVKKGDSIGLVGLSGFTRILHISISEL